MQENHLQKRLTLYAGVRIFLWELLQNTPIIIALGVALRYQATSFIQSLIAGMVGAGASAFIITATEKYKLDLESRPFKFKEFIYNALTFGIFVAIYLIYARSGSYFIDLIVGIALGLMGGVAQWVLLKQSFADGLRHTVALVAIAPLVLLLIRYSAHFGLPAALLILFGAAFVMTLIIASIDYYLPMSKAAGS